MIDELRRRLGPSLHALVGFGSCYSSGLARPGSIPDLFVFVDDLDLALGRLHAGPIARAIGRRLPPTTLSLDGRAKLNVLEPMAARRSLATGSDLYLAGRLSKRTVVLFSRDARAAAEVADLIEIAGGTVVALAGLDLPRRATVDETLIAALAISYRAEVRPERPMARAAALFAAHADEYRARLGPLVVERARIGGVLVEGDTLLDPRSDELRAIAAAHQARTLRRSRRRAVARWPKQVLVYRGWLRYVLGKLARAG